MIAVVDYGLGNLFSLGNALKFIGAGFKFIKAPEEAEAYILPGVGAFPEGMRRLQEGGFVRFLKENTKPLLGICLGMQLLFDSSEEFTHTEGLGLIPGKVTKLGCGEDLKIPHMGWNELTIKKPSPLTEGISGGSVYFVHSYRALPRPENLLATAFYGEEIAAIAGKGNVFGVQFHPEKSGDRGLKILKNYVNLAEKKE
jgi:imidazole glycerol phosphate synthase, glutamine amidotransferase subunit